ncbi:MAG TPA: HEAT repeat domain-containing protein [Thermoanaerobaculaceae bacterium]|nr:HEAT repeat domain-containing protein [Thermoanaerobaculaceae bacterium]HPS79323.1 HEAT repeat domain-containing protein [Thermoanaerobaculaceae bacterium]
MAVDNEAAILRMLTDVETLRRSLRLYPETHPALQPARERIRGSVATIAEHDDRATIAIGPDRFFWNQEEINAPASSPALQLIRVLFNLGVGALRLELDQTAEGLPLLAAHLSRLKEPPSEAERMSLLDPPDAFPGLEIVPIDLSGVQVVDADAEDIEKGGSRNVLRELAERMSQDGAFALAGQINEGELTAGMLAEILQESRDPESLFEHLFTQLGEVVRVRDETQRRMLLGEVREFLGELVGLLDPDRARLAVTVAFRHLPVAGDPERGIAPMVAAELLMDAVELMLAQGATIPDAVHRVLYRMSAPPSERPPEVSEESSIRARRLLAQIPLEEVRPRRSQDESFGLIMRPESLAAFQELTASLDPAALRTHLAGVLREAATVWGAEPTGEAASRRLGEELVMAIDEGDLESANRLVPVVANMRNPEAREAACATAARAAIQGLLVFEKESHQTLAGILFGLGEKAIPTILDAIAEEESMGVRKRLLEVVGSHGSAALPYIRPMLGDSRWYVVRNAAFLLRRLGDREAAPQLRLMLGRARPQVVEEILKTLVALQDPQWFQALTRTLDSEDPERQVTAVRVASHIRHPQVARALADRLRARHGNMLREPITIELIQAAGRQGDPAFLPVLKSILDLSQWRHRFALGPLKREAAVAIAQLASDEAAQLARNLTSDKDSELSAAVRAALLAPRRTAEDPE